MDRRFARVLAVLAVLAFVVGVPLATTAKAATACSLAQLEPQAGEFMVSQGVGGASGYSLLARGKETLAKVFLTLPSACSVGTGYIKVTAASLSVSWIGTGGPVSNPLFTNLGSAPSIPAKTIQPQSAADPIFVVPSANTVQGALDSSFDATFTATITYSRKAQGSATIETGKTKVFLQTKTFERQTNALRILVVPMGDATQLYGTQYTATDQVTVQNAMQTLARIYPVPAGTGDLAGTTGGIRYTVDTATLLDLKSISGAYPSTSPTKFCGTSATFATIKGLLAQYLLSHNTANPGATADRVVGVVGEAISSGSAAGCAEGMASVSSPESWIRLIADTGTAPSMSGALASMEVSHTFGLELNQASYHSPTIEADRATSRAYNQAARGFIVNDHDVMDFNTSTGPWDNTTTLLAASDFSYLLCKLTPSASTACVTPGNVGTASGVSAGPKYVIAGTTDGTSSANTHVVEPFYANNVAETPQSTGSLLRLIQLDNSNPALVLGNFGLPWSEVESTHGSAAAPTSPLRTFYAAAPGFSGAAGEVRVVKLTPGQTDPLATGTPILFSSLKIDPPTITSFTGGGIPTTGGSATFFRSQITPRIPPKPDIIFLADTTGSMNAALQSVKDNATAIMNDVLGAQPDAQFAVASYKDEPAFCADPYVFRLEQALTPNTAAVQTALGTWSAGGGCDIPEAALNALYRVGSGDDGAGVVTGGTWSATGSMSTGRTGHTATRLPNGKVLVAVGWNGSAASSSAELYDPAAGTWSATGSMIDARYTHTATLLSNGKVLVAGGSGINGGASISSVELYDPAAGTWSATGSMSTARAGHTATLLPDGRVVVAGGSGINSSAELYDPAAGTWSATGSMSTGREGHTATLLPSGKVLVAGGQNPAGSLSSAELYDPAAGTWSATGSMIGARNFHSASLLSNGKVLGAGGIGSSAGISSAELYDPAAGTWSATGSMTGVRYDHTATLLSNGKVLGAGGFGSSSTSISSAELYDPAAGTWSATGSMSTGREGHTATLLSNGNVLVAGGLGSSGAMSSAELYVSPTTTAATAIGYRNGSSRVAVWFGDAPGHDPSVGHTEAAATAALQNNGIRVIAVNMRNAAFNSSLDQTGQATRIAGATNGVVEQNNTDAQVAADILKGLHDLPAKVTPVVSGNCDAAMHVSFRPTDQTVRSGTSADFTELVAVDPTTEGPHSCQIVFKINDQFVCQPASEGCPLDDRFVQIITVNVSDGQKQTVTVTAQSTDPSRLLLDLVFQCDSGFGFLAGVAIPPASLTASTATFNANADRTNACARQGGGGTLIPYLSDGWNRVGGVVQTDTSSTVKAPTAAIYSPASNASIEWNATVPLRGSGEVSGVELPPSALSWSLRAPGAVSFTPVGGGSAIDIPAPSPNGWTQGTWTAKLTVTSAGGTVTATVSFGTRYQFIGFFNPIVNPPDINTGTAGKSLVLKWQLTSAGTPVSDLATIVTTTFAAVTTCDPNTAIVPFAKTSGQSTARFDQANLQFVFNWQTPSTVGLYLFRLTLSDGSQHDACASLK